MKSTAPIFFDVVSFPWHNDPIFKNVPQYSKWHRCKHNATLHICTEIW